MDSVDESGIHGDIMFDQKYSGRQGFGSTGTSFPKNNIQEAYIPTANKKHNLAATLESEYESVEREKKSHGHAPGYQSAGLATV